MMSVVLMNGIATTADVEVRPPADVNRASRIPNPGSQKTHFPQVAHHLDLAPLRIVCLSSCYSMT